MILALVSSAFILSLTLVPAMVALAFTDRVEEKENLFMRLARVLYTPVLTWPLRLRYYE